MKSEDNYFKYYNLLNNSKSLLFNDLITHNNLPLNKKNQSNNIQQDSYYLGGNSPKKDNEKYFVLKDTLECENETNIDKFLTKDIINSINEINSDSNSYSSKNESIKEVLIQDKTESYGDEKHSSHKNSEENDIINIKDLKDEKEIKDEFPINCVSNKSSDFPIKQYMTEAKGEIRQINYDNRQLNNNININNENTINLWNFNISPENICSIDNKKNQQNNKESQEINDDNIHSKIDDNNLKDNLINKNKDINNFKEILIKNGTFKTNIDDIKINNIEYSENKLLFDNDFINKKFNIFQNQYNNINFDNITNDKKSHNNSIENNFNKDNIIINNFNEQKTLNMNQFIINNKNESREDIKYNKLNNINKNLKESNDIKQEYSNIPHNDINLKLYNNNNFIYYNRYINLINPINKNIYIDSCRNISLEKDKDNSNQDDYLVTMFGKLGWMCRLCNNFNFESRNICNRCKVIKTPKTKDEIKENRDMNKKKIKKIKKSDWFCPYCNNINYFFRKNCNRCKIERKPEFPSFYLQHNEKSKGNNNIILAKNSNEIKNCLKNNINNNNYNFLDDSNKKNVHNFQSNYFFKSN